MKMSFVFSAVGTAPPLSFLSLSALCNVDGAEAEERGEGEASHGRDQNCHHEDDGMWWTALPNPDASNSPLQTHMRPDRCVRATNTPGA